MANPDFEATWIRRIGPEATVELHRGRRVAGIGITMPLVAIAAGLLLGTGTLDDVIGAVLAGVVAGYVGMFIRAQKRIAGAISHWYGVRIGAGQLPLMNPERFDAWRERAGLGHVEQPDGSQRLEPLRMKYDHKWGPIRWSRPGRRDPS
jgi:hypothetical protein